MPSERLPRLPARLLVGLGTLAATVLSGCYDMHGRPGETPDAGLVVSPEAGPLPDAPVPALDAPAPIASDGGTCEETPLEGYPVELTCPDFALEGEPIVVTFRHASGACCPDSAALPTQVRPGRDTPDFGLVASWSACECCLECACAGGVATENVTIGAFGAGTTVGVSAGSLHCSVPVVAVGATTCRPGPPSAWLVPHVVRAGESVPVGVVSSATSCGCTPRVVGPSAGGSDVTLELCDCCDACLCDDPPADGTVEITPTTPGPWTWTAATGETSPTVVAIVSPETTCYGARIVEASLAAPDAMRRSATPNAVWLRLVVESLGCCLEPAPFVATDFLRGGPPQFSLRTYECGLDACDCDTFGVLHTETFHYLGSWPSGSYAVALGDGLPPLEFTIP